jgi:hypothetical protein
MLSSQAYYLAPECFPLSSVRENQRTFPQGLDSSYELNPAFMKTMVLVLIFGFLCPCSARRISVIVDPLSNWVGTQHSKWLRGAWLMFKSLPLGATRNTYKSVHLLWNWEGSCHQSSLKRSVEPKYTSALWADHQADISQFRLDVKLPKQTNCATHPALHFHGSNCCLLLPKRFKLHLVAGWSTVILHFISCGTVQLAVLFSGTSNLQVLQTTAPCRRNSEFTCDNGLQVIHWYISPQNW